MKFREYLNLSEEVKVGTKQACVVHGHPKKVGSKTDKPIGTPIKCYSFDKYGRKEAIKKAHAMHYAIQKSQEIKEISDEYLTKPEIMKRVNFLKSTQRYASGEDRRKIDKELEYWNKILINPERNK